jgi:hypothetical protein
LVIVTELTVVHEDMLLAVCEVSFLLSLCGSICFLNKCFPVFSHCHLYNTKIRGHYLLVQFAGKKIVLMFFRLIVVSG